MSLTLCTIVALCLIYKPYCFLFNRSKIGNSSYWVLAIALVSAN